ncbi:hypothetical protein [Nocardia blacklockiae]|uniref:hypothetical protein n=1 Tax=Nocardia blacklockiae TaxID=480036 RepID=UPI0018937725|nr:hypothetical protein [Nocardia blacklockiae]MBF6172350.1 hypothetical protein [Nocardia blacklockiae]
MLTQTLWEIATRWGEQSAIRQQRNRANAARQSELHAHVAADRSATERRAMSVRLHGVGSESWWRAAPAATVLAAWFDAQAWCRDDPIADHARRQLADGLLEQHGIDVAEIEQQSNPAALEQAIENAYSTRAAKDRAQTAQRYATDAVAAAEHLDDEHRRYAGAAIAQYGQAAARMLANRRRAIPVERGDRAIRESARVAIELVLSASSTDRDKVLFALDYLTGDTPADLATADWEAHSDIHAKVDAALREYQRRLTHGADISRVTAEITELIRNLPGPEGRLVGTRAARIIATPSGWYPWLWPGAVRKDLLGRQITDYVRASWSHSAGNGRQAAELRGMILDRNSELSRIERDQLTLTLADVEEPGLSPLPRTLWADHESQYRANREQVYHDTVVRSVNLVTRITELLTVSGIDPHAPQLGSVHGSVAALCRECERVAVNGSDTPPAGHRALADQLARAGIAGSLRADILSAATHLQTTSVWVSATARRQDEQPPDRSATRG